MAAHTVKYGIRLQHTCQPYSDFNHFGCSLQGFITFVQGFLFTDCESNNT